MNYRRSDLIEIYKSEMERFNKTRDIQWKFNVTAWTLLVLAIEFKSRTSLLSYCCVEAIAIIIFFLGHLIFVLLIQYSLTSSKAIWKEVLNSLNNYNSFIKIKIKTITNNKKWKQYDTFWVIFQLLITGFLLFIFAAV